MNKFKNIRLSALKMWSSSLKRVRNEGDFTDDYSDSDWCKIQDACTKIGKHCSFICSLGDWLDNISDLLYEDRYDNLTDIENSEVLFRYYTRILLIASEIIEDFIILNKEIQAFDSKSKARKDLEDDTFINGELERLSRFINTICKHKTEHNNLHLHNNHMYIYFEDFGSESEPNQISLQSQDWSIVDKETSLLIPKLHYILNVLVKLNYKTIEYINDKAGFKEKMLDKFQEEWHCN